MMTKNELIKFECKYERLIFLLRDDDFKSKSRPIVLSMIVFRCYPAVMSSTNGRSVVMMAAPTGAGSHGSTYVTGDDAAV